MVSIIGALLSILSFLVGVLALSIVVGVLSFAFNFGKGIAKVSVLGGAIKTITGNADKLVEIIGAIDEIR